MSILQTTFDLDTIRDSFDIGDHISDEVMSAFAENWFDFADAEWSELEESFCGVFGSLDEDEAIGDYLFDLATDCGHLENVPDWIRYHIDWQSVGRDGRLSGEFRATVVRHPTVAWQRAWAVFRNW